jgi:TolB-like protein
MKPGYVVILAFAAAMNTLAQAPKPQTPTIAVLDFESREEAVHDLGPKLAALVNVGLAGEPNLITVERAELEKALGEQELGLSGTVQAESAAKVGHLTGAKVLVTGRVFKADKELIVVAKIIGTETSRIYAEMVKGTAATPITELASELAQKIANTVNREAPSLIGKRENLGDAVARIKTALSGKSLPSVVLHITERHFGQPVIDPAAETEIATLLQQSGFKLLSEVSTAAPEVVISGEAFSAFGFRKGNLISCKARIELKAVRANGEIAVVDRQTSVAVDITEQTAAKSALQNAADELAERIIPLLAR